MTEENLNKSTSRKNVKASQNNRVAVREIVEKAISLGYNKYMLIDDSGNRIYVDTENGLTGLMVPVVLDGQISFDIKWYEDGSTSSKNNGYVYTPIVITEDYIHKTILYGTHSLICMVKDKDGFDYIESQGLTPICNHKDNKSWNNKGDNLEWTTQGFNVRHGKIVSSLQHYFYEKYTHIEHNAGNTDFIILNNKLSVNDIQRYVEEIDSKYEFKCGNCDYINDQVLEAFVDWLFNNNIWTNIKGER